MWSLLFFVSCRVFYWDVLSLRGALPMFLLFAGGSHRHCQTHCGLIASWSFRILIFTLCCSLISFPFDNFLHQSLFIFTSSLFLLSQVFYRSWSGSLSLFRRRPTVLTSRSASLPLLTRFFGVINRLVFVNYHIFQSDYLLHFFFPESFHEPDLQLPHYLFFFLFILIIILQLFLQVFPCRGRIHVQVMHSDDLGLMPLLIPSAHRKHSHALPEPLSQILFLTFALIPQSQQTFLNVPVNQNRDSWQHYVEVVLFS